MQQQQQRRRQDRAPGGRAHRGMAQHPGAGTWGGRQLHGKGNNRKLPCMQAAQLKLPLPPPHPPPHPRPQPKTHLSCGTLVSCSACLAASASSGDVKNTNPIFFAGTTALSVTVPKLGARVGGRGGK